MSAATQVEVPRPFTAPPAFDAVYREYARTVGRWAARLGSPTVDVEDIVQDVFVVVSRRLPEFRGTAHVSTWLFQITRKTVANHHRKHRLRRWLSLSREVEERVPAPALTPGESLERRQAAADLYRVLETLPDKYRTVLVLYELEELPTIEIARLLGAKVSTVKVWLFRARARFLDQQEQLEKKGVL